jgi:transcriptional regulator with XRE-family HTH domain
MPPLNAILRQLREGKGLTQYGLAVAAGLTPAAVAKLEQGATADPGWLTVCKLADALGVSTEAFRDEHTPEAPPRGPGRPRKVSPRGKAGKQKGGKG